MIRSEWNGISVCILRQLQCLPNHLTTVFVVPTPAVSYSDCHPNTRRQLQCL